MRLFVSYARVDKPYCIQIINQLTVHDIWYDQRLYAGQQWWKEILRRLDWCEGFIYLLSPDSVASEYCQRELQIAIKLKRQIIPILIQPETVIPGQIQEMQYVDLTGGVNVDGVSALLNSIYIAETQRETDSSPSVKSIKPDEVAPPIVSSNRVVGMAAKAMEQGAYDQAIFLLKQAKLAGYKSRFINIDKLLKEAELELERKSNEKEAKREYRQILDLMEYESTRDHACEALAAFFEIYPNYDPENIASRCEKRLQRSSRAASSAGKARVVGLQEVDDIDIVPEQIVGKAVEFVTIPGGHVRTDGLIEETYNATNNGAYVPEFQISKFPITNRQYELFLRAPDGYCMARWWEYLERAVRWRKQNPQPKPSAFQGGERPRETVSWYDAVAYVNWLSYKMNMPLSLPSVCHWQRAVQGSDDRSFPWGNQFDIQRCNTRESQLKMTTRVDRYDQGVSDNGVYDLAGNIWEWCVDHVEGGEDDREVSSRKQAVVGGSFVSPIERAKIDFRYYLLPETVYSSIGFRVVSINN